MAQQIECATPDEEQAEQDLLAGSVDRGSPPAALASLIAVNEDGFLSLTSPYAGNEALFSAFESWRWDACEHHDMTYVEEKVSGFSRAWLKSELEDRAESSS